MKEKKNPVQMEFQIEKSLFVRSWKLTVFCLLLLVEILLMVTNWKSVYFAGIPSWYVELPVCFALTVENAVKIWAARKPGMKIMCYVFDSFALLALTIFSDGQLISTLYIVILSEFYFTQKNLVPSIAMGATSIGIFLIAFSVSGALRGENVNAVSLITKTFNDLILLVLHFLIVNFSVQIFRRNREMKKALDELNESNQKLEEAYRDLQEVTVLEERQRIAKDIHDTAGHAITTVIMQTEAAKLVLDSDPDEARRRISAANLQAKNALEELRESVHLLSGGQEHLTLKQLLEGIVHDSTDGTGITVRYEIDEITVCDAKRRFLCNSLKEGISNGLRHGGATAFWFELREEGGNLSFLLSDNGTGMDAGELREGMGLSGMCRRAESLGGKSWFETERGEGFEVHITLPADSQ